VLLLFRTWVRMQLEARRVTVHGKNYG
jgi:hypothetical protein